MPFVRSDLTCSQGGGQAIYTYHTVDAAAVVAADGYFNQMSENFKLLDVIHVVSDVVYTPALPGVQGSGAPQISPHIAAGTLTTYFVSQVNDAAVPRPLPDVRLTASA